MNESSMRSAISVSPSMALRSLELSVAADVRIIDDAVMTSPRGRSAASVVGTSSGEPAADAPAPSSAVRATSISVVVTE